MISSVTIAYRLWSRKSQDMSTGMNRNRANIGMDNRIITHWIRKRRNYAVTSWTIENASLEISAITLMVRTNLPKRPQSITLWQSSALLSNKMESVCMAIDANSFTAFTTSKPNSPTHSHSEKVLALPTNATCRSTKIQTLNVYGPTWNLVMDAVLLKSQDSNVSRKFTTVTTWKIT